MGVASLVLGIVSFVFGFIPCVNYIATVPAIIGLILGIVDAVKKSKAQEPKGMAIAGIILSALALVWGVIAIIGTAALFAAAEL